METFFIMPVLKTVCSRFLLTNVDNFQELVSELWYFYVTNGDNIKNKL